MIFRTRWKGPSTTYDLQPGPTGSSSKSTAQTLIPTCEQWTMAAHTLEIPGGSRDSFQPFELRDFTVKSSAELDRRFVVLDAFIGFLRESRE